MSFLRALKAVAMLLGRGFNTRRPSLMILVTEKNVAIIRFDGAGEILFVHLRTGETVFSVIDDGGS
jgi:hypothetical protein